MVGGIDDRDDEQGWDDEPLEPSQQLPLDDDDERLPWLESADDEDEDYEQGSGTGRMVVLALAGFLAVAALAGAAWWFGNRGGDGTAIADGSTIKAPAEPYKVPPKDPGGKTFDGTGDSSFAVSEGQTRTARLDGSEAPPSPSIAVTPSVAPSMAAAKPSASAAPTPAAASGPGVQVGAFSSQASAEAGWSRLVAAHGSILSGVGHRVIAGKADIGTVYRLQATAGDAASAQALCGKLKAAGVPCQVK